jgi:beta-fructofuranosidase
MNRREVLKTIIELAGSLLIGGCQPAFTQSELKGERMNTTLTVDEQLQAKFRSDPQRPVFHFLPPKNWMNDPNGLIQWKGTYHLFYQHNPDEAKWGPMYWGHATSPDLVHWTHRPIAMGPTPNSPDEDGCWSGCAVNDHGRPVIVYSGNRKKQQRACLAFSNDDLQTLEKYAGNPVIPDLPEGCDISEYRDHCVWHDGSQWNQLIGAGIKNQGGTVFLYRSDDLKSWKLVGPICQGKQAESGSMWECPDLFAVGNKHLLVTSIFSFGSSVSYTGCFLGTYADGKFTPEGFRRLDFGDREYYAPQSFVNQAGERIQFGWLGEGRREDACLEAGWAGVMSLPRVFGLTPDGRLSVVPHPAVKSLRGQAHNLGEVQVTSSEQELAMAGRALELHAVFGAGSTAKRYGLKVLCAPDGSEETAIVFEPAARKLKVVREKSSLDARCAYDAKGGEIDLAGDEDLDLQIFLDHSVVEIFINGRLTLTTRVYPTLKEADRVRVFAEDGACTLKSLDAWEMNSIW